MFWPLYFIQIVKGFFPFIDIIKEPVQKVKKESGLKNGERKIEKECRENMKRVHV